MSATSAPLLTTHQLAAYIGIARETARRYAEEGIIPASKIGRRWRFRQADVDDYIASLRRINLVPRK